MTEPLKPCPCGETPTKLYVNECGVYGSSTVCGDCCADWHFGPVEDLPGYPTTAKKDSWAISAWNRAPRGKE